MSGFDYWLCWKLVRSDITVMKRGERMNEENLKLKKAIPEELSIKDLIIENRKLQSEIASLKVKIEKLESVAVAARGYIQLEDIYWELAAIGSVENAEDYIDRFTKIREQNATAQKILRDRIQDLERK